MAALEYPKVVYGPGGQSRRIMSKEAFAQLGPEWKTSRAQANPESEYPKYVYKGTESKVCRTAEDVPEGWVDSIKEALEVSKTPVVPAKPKVITAPDGSTSIDGGVTWKSPERPDVADTVAPDSPSEIEGQHSHSRGRGRPRKEP